MLGFLRDSDECNGLLIAHRLNASYSLKLHVKHELLIPILQVLGPLDLHADVVGWTGWYSVGRPASLLWRWVDYVQLTEQRHSLGWAHLAVASIWNFLILYFSESEV